MSVEQSFFDEHLDELASNAQIEADLFKASLGEERVRIENKKISNNRKLELLPQVVQLIRKDAVVTAYAAREDPDIPQSTLILRKQILAGTSDEVATSKHLFSRLINRSNKNKDLIADTVYEEVHEFHGWLLAGKDIYYPDSHRESEELTRPTFLTKDGDILHLRKRVNYDLENTVITDYKGEARYITQVDTGRIQFVKHFPKNGSKFILDFSSHDHNLVHVASEDEILSPKNVLFEDLVGEEPAALLDWRDTFIGIIPNNYINRIVGRTVFDASRFEYTNYQK